MNWAIQRFETVDSTMQVAAPLPIGSAVVADEQSSGLGRHGHSWDSRRGAGLYLSLVLSPIPALTLALGLAAHFAISKVTSLECDLRWPNDLMLAGRKVGGILVQIHDTRAVAGIGINIGQQSFPPELKAIATSLLLETGLEFRRDDLLDALLDSVPRWASLPPREIIENWERVSSWAHGKPVQVEVGGRMLTGVTAGLDSAGFLRIRKADGEISLVVAGGVRPLQT